MQLQPLGHNPTHRPNRKQSDTQLHRQRDQKRRIIGGGTIDNVGPSRTTSAASHGVQAGDTIAGTHNTRLFPANVGLSPSEHATKRPRLEYRGERIHGGTKRKSIRADSRASKAPKIEPTSNNKEICMPSLLQKLPNLAAKFPHLTGRPPE